MTGFSVTLLTLPFLILMATNLYVEGLTCDKECEEYDCYGIEPICKGTQISQTLSCGCCVACAKQEGEQCGGPYFYYGRCEKWLTCYSEYAKYDKHAAGTCIPKGLAKILKS